MTNFVANLTEFNISTKNWHKTIKAIKLDINNPAVILTMLDSASRGISDMLLKLFKTFVKTNCFCCFSNTVVYEHVLIM